MKISEKILLSTENKQIFTVYLLYLNDKLVYVGKTTRPIEIRVKYHANNSIKIFDSFKVIDCSSEKEMNELEAKLIFKHIPKYNKQLPLLPSQNIICIGLIKEYENINKRLGKDVIILNGLVYIKLHKIRKE
jgi:predicted GIY-YIG superfamily endonuclease